MSRHSYFAQFLADASGRTILVSTQEELTARGCAQLAALGIGAAISPVPLPPLRYEPRGNQQTLWLQRFRSAVDRSRNWRSK
jgi:glycerol kinase